jgi:hypothetical protein
MSNPPDTLIGLGPPDPPQKYGEDAGDAPETFRAWTSSSSDIQPLEGPEQASAPAETLFHTALIRSRSAFGTPRRSSRVWWAAAAIAAGVALVFIGVSLERHHRPRVTPVVAARAPSTTRVVGGPWVLSPDAPALPEDASETDADASHIPFREPRVTHHHHTAPVIAHAKPEEAPATLTPDPSRIEAMAGTVELEEESSEAARPDEPAAPETATPDPGSPSAAE